MNKRTTYFLFFFLCLTVLSLESKVNYNQYFINGTMRIDYYHIGNSSSEVITLDKVYKYEIWAGNHNSLIEPSKVAMYFVKIYEVQSKTLIYSKGFNSYFGEYETSNKALEGIKKTFHETALIPYPKQNILFTIEKRNRSNIIKRVFSTMIDIKDLTIEKNIFNSEIKVFNILNNGLPKDKVDIAVIAEGYKRDEIKKVRSDLEKFKETLFSLEPYKSRKNDFNIYGVFKPSVDSGCDEPSHGVYKNTAVNTTFFSMGSERYLLTEDNKSLRDIAGHVRYDTLFIMVNHKRYGGGGIYNFYCTFTSDNTWNNYLILHEFGHSFTGLADEYYSSSTAYNDFYPKGIEPVEPNITALLDPKDVKWKDLLTKGLPVPTKWNKIKYDNMDMAYQKIRYRINRKLAELKRKEADRQLINKIEEKSERLSIQASERSDDFLKSSRYSGKIGVFEGAGYSSEGLYRSMIDCIMFTKGVKPYCTVCNKAVEEQINYYTRGEK